MHRDWSFFVDGILLTGIVIAALVLTHAVLDGIASAQAVALVTPVTLLPPEPTDTSMPTPPPTASATRPPARTATPRPTASPRPSATYTPSPIPSSTPTPTEMAEFELRGIAFPSVTPNGTLAIRETPIPPPAPTVQLPRG